MKRVIILSEKQTLADIILSTRKKLNLSTRDLAEEFNINKSEISKIENGKRLKPNILTLGKLSEALNLQLEMLMELAGYENNEVYHAKNIYEHTLKNSRTPKPLKERSIVTLYFDHFLLMENMNKHQKQIEIWEEICEKIDNGTFKPKEKDVSTNKQDYIDAIRESEIAEFNYRKQIIAIEKIIEKKK